MKKILLTLILTLIAPLAAAQIGGIKTSTCIAFTVPATVAKSQGTLTLSAAASNGAAITFESRTTSKCTIIGAVATLRAEGPCIIVARSAATASHIAGQTSATLTINADAPPPPPPVDPGIRAIKIFAASPVTVNQAAKITATVTGKADWVDFYADGVRLGRVTVAPYEWLYTPTKTGAVKASVEASIAGPKGAGYFGAEITLDVKTGSVIAPTPWTQAQKFFAACGPCPSTGKVETEACAGHDIIAIDGGMCVDSAKCKWVPL
jgi:hypothetical protein